MPDWLVGRVAAMGRFLILAGYVGLAGFLLALVHEAHRIDEARASREGGPLWSRSFEIRVGLLALWFFFLNPLVMLLVVWR